MHDSFLKRMVGRQQRRPHTEMIAKHLSSGIPCRFYHQRKTRTGIQLQLVVAIDGQREINRPTGQRQFIARFIHLCIFRQGRSFTVDDNAPVPIRTQSGFAPVFPSQHVQADFLRIFVQPQRQDIYGITLQHLRQRFLHSVLASARRTFHTDHKPGIGLFIHISKAQRISLQGRSK